MTRRALFVSDAIAIASAFYLSSLWWVADGGALGRSNEIFLFVVTFPVWFVLFGLLGLYRRDEERADHGTVDDFFGIVQVVTLGVWFVEVTSVVTGVASPSIERLTLFWAFAIGLTMIGRSAARSICRRQPGYAKRVVVVGEGDIGQLVARKIGQHPEYGLDLLGFVDGDPKGRRADVSGVRTLGDLDSLASIVADLDVDRVVVAFSREPDTDTMAVLRDLRNEGIMIDVVPRLFELVGLRSTLHVLEGLALVCVPPAKLSRPALLLKRLTDLVAAAILLILVTPFLIYAAIRIKLDSPGPVFFRQTRLGMGQVHFSAYKFRSMRVDTDEEEHRAYIRSIKDASATVGDNGVYKLNRPADVTSFGRWLRKTSLDELPQLINVLRGEMSLVGPRPCIPYETENFLPHHFDRFLVPQGMTGLWQVTARANATFGEALDMDVAYVQGWSYGLDLRLMLRTPLVLVHQRTSTT
jgi:exopolysaccharide biosynthesis polyprenyl glycosylphosphotransferase